MPNPTPFYTTRVSTSFWDEELALEVETWEADRHREDPDPDRDAFCADWRASAPKRGAKTTTVRLSRGAARYLRHPLSLGNSIDIWDGHRSEALRWDGPAEANRYNGWIRVAERIQAELDALFAAEAEEAGIELIRSMAVGTRFERNDREYEIVGYEPFGVIRCEHVDGGETVRVLRSSLVYPEGPFAA